MKRILSVLLIIMLLLSMIPDRVIASMNQACNGYEIKMFQGKPACVDANGNLHICEKNFPDPEFMRLIKDRFQNKKDVLSNEDVLSIKNINCDYSSIEDLSGIEYFTALTQLTCGNNKLEELDISNLTALVNLRCENNLIRSLNVSNNTALDLLSCSNNYISKLDISKCTNLATLVCECNYITQLDTSKNSKLSSLLCGNNRLTTVNLSNNKELADVFLYRQNVGNIAYTIDGNKCTIDLSKIVGKGNINNIVSLSGRSGTSALIKPSYNSKTGIAVFNAIPKTITYHYNFKNTELNYAKMDVTATLRDPYVLYDDNHHKATLTLKQATTGANGMLYEYCPTCKKEYATIIIPQISSIKLSSTNYRYNGKVNTPTVIVKDKYGKLLKKDTDYLVSYSSGKKVNRYAVQITFKGYYTGSKTLYYTIYPTTTNISKLTAGIGKFTVKWSKKKSEVTGYQIQYAKNQKLDKAKTVTVNKNSTSEKTIKKLSKKQTYYVRIRTYKNVKINGKNTKLYSAWSQIKTIRTKK